MTASAAVEAVHLGPTWERNPDWDGVDPLTKYVLPELTLGWQILAWIEDNLLNDEGGPFKPTPEQARLVLWWYAIDERGRFIYREGVLQRLKGWGKDPIAAAISAVEFVGPCRFAGWATVDMPDKDVYAGDPVAKANPRAWVQIAAVSKDQTRNTMTIFPSLFTKACRDEHGIDLGKEVIYAYHGARRIEAVTSSPRALEGGRPTFVVKNETHHWLANNEGHDMADVIERNATKSKGGAARSLSITNAYEPSEDSVAQREREAWEAEESGEAIATGVMYDSLEAPADARLRPVVYDDNGRKREPSDEEVIAYLTAVVEAVRGDASWLDVESIVKSILDGKRAPSTSRRFWFNQVVAAEDAWVDPAAVDAGISELAKSARRDTSDVLRAGWLVHEQEEVVIFFDGSKSDDDTALVGCRLSDGYVFTLGHWYRPPGEAGKGWRVPRGDVDQRVCEVMGRFNVVAFWADPSHAKEDDDATSYWAGMIDDWHRRYKDRLQVWSLKTGNQMHSILWDMTSPERHRQFVEAAERFVEEMETLDDVEEFKPAFTHDGNPALMRHLKNARRNPSTRWGVSLMKDGRESSRKIDLAVCAVGARMLRRVVLNRGLEEEKVTTGAVWGAW